MDARTNADVGGLGMDAVDGMGRGQACMALHNLSNISGNARKLALSLQRLRSCGAVEVISTALVNHADSSRVQKWGRRSHPAPKITIASLPPALACCATTAPPRGDQKQQQHHLLPASSSPLNLSPYHLSRSLTSYVLRAGLRRVGVGVSFDRAPFAAADLTCSRTRQSSVRELIAVNTARPSTHGSMSAVASQLLSLTVSVT
eukprot:1049281-Rhodomonas_salina.1